MGKSKKTSKPVQPSPAPGGGGIDPNNPYGYTIVVVDNGTGQTVFAYPFDGDGYSMLKRAFELLPRGTTSPPKGSGPHDNIITPLRKKAAKPSIGKKAQPKHIGKKKKPKDS